MNCSEYFSKPIEERPEIVVEFFSQGKSFISDFADKETINKAEPRIVKDEDKCILETISDLVFNTIKDHNIIGTHDINGSYFYIKGDFAMQVRFA